MTDLELLQMALDALEEAQDYTSCPTYSPSMTQQCAVAAVALRARLALPEPWVKTYSGGKPNYTEPKEWVGLTDAEIKDILDCGRGGLVDIKKAEAKLKDKNT